MNDSVIEVENLNVYQDKNLVLKDVSFSVNKGEFVYLIGRTGSGKSSLLKILYGDLRVPKNQGTVKVAGEEVHAMKRRKIPQLRRKLGVVFQDFQLLSDRNVEDNLLFVLKATGWKDKKKMKSRVEEVLKSVELQTKGYKYPHELSGGEQQRVSIARALLNDPDLIIADEPTGNLDPQTSETILNLLFEICRKNHCAVLMATHDIALIEKYPSRTLVCENSTVTEKTV
ncbi:MAG: ATP-binding cassette domain-containing protein [Bacteroidetes bacterium]|nr:MAG: ATP-binding cassette domain-containing protein [Bacteroidota bacterium]